MNHLKLVAFLFFLIFFSKTYSQIIASLELSNPPVENNLTHFTVTDPNIEPYTIQTVNGGEPCREIPKSKYGYFNAGSVIASTDNNLIFHITFYDQGTDNIFFQYNATNTVNYKNVIIPRTSSNQWVTATIALTDASFRNAQNNGCDFRLSTGGNTSCFVKYISIEKGTLNPALEPVPVTSASNYSEFIGKSVAGYQAWFKTGTPFSGWFHWYGTTQPSAGKLNFEVYPDVSEYKESDLTQTGFANLGNGNPAKLFNSSNTDVINLHFSWMKNNGIDGVALQRFINGIGSVIIDSKEASPVRVMRAAEATGRIFYICYDISSTGLDATWDDIIKFDWVYNIEKNYALTASPSYARVGNKPVVQVWGTGFTGNHPGTAQETIDLINFLKARGCYVIGGVPTNWRTGTGDSKTGFLDAYKTYDMISPWSVGRFSDINGVNSFKTTSLIPDKTFTDQNGIAYLPVIFPGFSWSQWNGGVPNSIPRQAGKFLWQQALNIKSLGLKSMYFAMFDEYDEATANMKAATDWTMIPTDQYFVTLSADGTWLSSDFYLRLANAAIDLIKGTRTETQEVPIAHSNGPVFYRNSFEKRFAKYNKGANSGYFNIDPCFYNPAVSANAGTGNGAVTLEKDSVNAHSGLYLCKINGTSASATNAIYYYKIAEVKIAVQKNLLFSFWKYTSNDLGRFTTVDLKFKSGKVLRDLPAYQDHTGNGMHPGNGRGTIGQWEKFYCQIGKGELVGDEINEILVAYDHPAESGIFTAYFDDILIESSDVMTGISAKPTETPSAMITTDSGLVIIRPSKESVISIFNSSGQLVRTVQTHDSEIRIPLPEGLYIIQINSEGKNENQKVFVK